ncbi:MAG: nucleotidyltransferase domain-containing protein [Streptosporangiaceae bacterium]
MDPSDLPADIARLLERLRDRLVARGGLAGIYLYGSLATGDFSPARSDIDLVVMVNGELDQAALGELGELHAALAGSDDPAGRLHCLYVPGQAAADPARLHPYWYGDRMTRWQLKVLTRAELASAGVALHGPWPPPGVAPVSTAEVQAAVREEIGGYWRRMARQRACWLRDSWVDLGLTVLPRSAAVLTTGELITKSEAIGRLAGFGVPAELAREIRRRRDGQVVTLSAGQRVRRAQLTRQIMRHGVSRLSQQ